MKFYIKLIWRLLQAFGVSPIAWMEYLILPGAMITFIILLMIAARVWRQVRQRHYDVPARDVRKGHRWVMVDSFTQTTYCSVSEHRIVEGAYCDSCGICVEDQHVRVADKTLKCKELSTSEDVMVHRWIKGNLPVGSVCVVCDCELNVPTELCDVRCCWCDRTAHEKCSTLSHVSQHCDLGRHRQIIVPPNCVRLKLVGVKGRRHYVVESVKEPTIKGWSPLIVMANRQSGNGEAESVLQSFRRILNPVQVIDLLDTSPECALAWCTLLPHVTCRVLVAGGDGTVGWVLAAVDKLKLKPAPHVGVLPLGTGNDLSRVLGWGEGYDSANLPIWDFIEKVKNASVVSLDRWQMEITPRKHFGLRMPKRKLIINNYASIGVDALVTLNFHRRRISSPKLFGSRFINKLWYFTYGTRDVLERECKNLDAKLKVELDGREVKLESIEGLVMLNIASWGGGCRPWTICCGANYTKIPEARYDDGLLEVFALYSSFHIAQLQVGLAEPLRLGQAKHVKITLIDGSAPMQVDGEPWEQHPATIIVSAHNQVNMLANTS